jgi:hypothetical protein
MGAWAGPFIVAALLLAIAGGLKAYDPTMTVGALRGAGITVLPVVVRIGGALELVLGVVAIATGAPAAAVLVAVSYLAFTAFVVVALRRRFPIGSCGCFGRADTPPSRVHVVVNIGAVIAAAGVALGSGGGIAAVLDDQVAAGLPFLLFVVTATYLAFLALTRLPQLQELGAATSAPRGSGS